MVTIDLNTYNELLIKAEKYETLLDCMYESAQLSWNEKCLNYNDEIISSILRTLDSSCYLTTLERLKEEKAKKENADE